MTMTSTHRTVEHSDIPGRETMIQRARDMIPRLIERAERQADHRRILPETMTEMVEAGLFRVLQPKRWGGYELDPGTFAEVQFALSEGDASVGWVYGVVGVHSWHLALFDDRAAQDVWGSDSSVLIGSPYAPGTARPVDDGYIFNGRWKFSSGSEYCGWTFLGGIVDPEKTAGRPFLEADYRTFLLPRQDYEIVDTWHVNGLKGTGSHDIIVKDMFVPAYRTLDFRDVWKRETPGQTINANPLYKLPFVQVFHRAVSNASIGALQGMLNAFLEYGAKRVGAMGMATVDDPDALLAAAAAASGIDEMKLVLHRNFDLMAARAENGESISQAEALQFRYQCSSVPDRCLDLARALYKASGSGGVYTDRSIGRYYNDLMVAAQHGSNNGAGYGRVWGKKMFGLDIVDAGV
ncbi:acyl-CoA dehydrogenase family protein [Sphingosinicella soli]|uniref:3-hydroxy-9,10-secoandrosta-1,3,5(10)-triene-9, 17-dione monooxygenase n=1 Tax=Sphingosinicella soli TaxID=333708 RepID=A0A7W7B2B0_9SPHN|nr:acyl-CoA dehydrogenase family protein [Sphingosinicella soli]MBB4632686.1 3-hydroxy-9,10-secoandrosta-1,3,5(10)-triene-9,17-dione monooxygenase [Sphingosinicella soli]